MSGKKLVLKRKAEQDLENIFEYSYRQFGQKKAENYIKNIDNAFNQLLSMPEIARNCSYVSPGLKAFQVASHIIFFRLAENGISVVRVLHQTMDYPSHIEK